MASSYYKITIKLLTLREIVENLCMLPRHAHRITKMDINRFVLVLPPQDNVVFPYDIIHIISYQFCKSYSVYPCISADNCHVSQTGIPVLTLVRVDQCTNVLIHVLIGAPLNCESDYYQLPTLPQ